MSQEELHTFRPIKPLAVFFTLVALILAIVAVAASNWVDVAFQEGTLAWGLWEECLSYTVNSRAVTVCVSKDWMSACGAMVVIALIACIIAIPMGLLGICSKTRTWFIIAGILDIVGALCMFISLVIYPAKFTPEMQSFGSSGWNFDWTYGIGWGGLFFMLGAGILFLLKIPEHQITTRQSNHIYINRAI